jgi:hypothetical protein
MNLLGLPSLSDINFNFNISNTANNNVDIKNEDGYQILTMIAEGFEYTPTSSTTIKAGVPTKLIVDNQGIQGCGSFMASYGLIESFVSLQPGENIIDLGEPVAGTYKVTCSMGMVPPVTINVI